MLFFREEFDFDDDESLKLRKVIKKTENITKMNKYLEDFKMTRGTYESLATDKKINKFVDKYDN